MLDAALEHYRSGRLTIAAQICQQILQQSENVEALHLSGLIAARQQQFEQAIGFYQRVIALQPQHLEAYNNLGIALMQLERLREAIDCYQQALNLAPDRPEVWVNLGNALQANGDLESAIDCYQKALAIQPDLAAAHKNLAHVLRMQGRLTAAMGHHGQAIDLVPNDAEAHFGYAFTLLIAGDLSAGFAEYEWRWRLKYHQPRRFEKPFEQPQWDGSALMGRFRKAPSKPSIFLYAEQGFGDTLQFIRYAMLLASQGRVVVECQKPLLRLLKLIPQIAVIAQGEPLPAFDVHAPLLSLPHLMAMDTIPAAPYLQPPAVQPLFQAAPNTRFKIGIAWAGDPKNPNNRRRSAPLSHFLKLLDIPGVTLYSLQKGAEVADLKSIQHPRLIDLSESIDDFADTAAIVSQLDLVISIDSAVAHLAGAIGKPVWVILPFSPDWRWQLEREDCPWYPTMRLFRQKRPNDWAEVFTKVVEALQCQGWETLFTMLPKTSEPSLPSVGIGWQISSTLGWGAYGLNLALQLLRCDRQPVLLLPPMLEEIANPLHRWQIRSLRRGFAESPTTPATDPAPYPVLYALNNGFTILEAASAAIGNPKIGVVFFEQSHLSSAAVKRAKQYDRIITGSTWNEQILKRHGVENVVTVRQGIDPTMFHIAPRSTLFHDRFVIFSGGKLDYRQGQDIVIAAFRIFRDRHPEALLMVAWQNDWTQFVAGIEQAGHVVGLPPVKAGKMQIGAWLAQNGIPPASVLDLGSTVTGQVLRSADVAVFPNRAEGSTNLVAMAALACGVPTILSANTGHLDLLNCTCYPLTQQTRVKPTDRPHTEGWGESSLEELVDLMEQVYVDRSAAQQKGIAAAQFMQNWTWEKHTQRLLKAIESTS